MRNIFTYLFLVISIVSFTSCFRNGSNDSSSFSSSADEGKLTQQKAQNALSIWMNGGQVTVRGIQEMPKENAAKADVTFTNFKFKADGFDKNYTGPGTAVFTHYNDGRWVLTNVVAGQGITGVWWNNLSVEVR